MYVTRQQPAMAPAALATPSAEPGVSRMEQMGWLAFILLHVPLGMWMRNESTIVFAQGALTFLVGMWWALNPARPERVAYVGGYIVGSEVLWRMLTDALPWESGKYGLIVILTTALMNRGGLSSLIGPALCFGLLLPSVFLTVRGNDVAAVVGMLSFNLTGPLALVLCARFFSGLELSPARTLRLFLSLVAPVVAIGSVVVDNIMSAAKIEFTYESNFATSGGFGPNQVSLALGLGGLAALWCVLERGVVWPLRVSMLALMLWLFSQSALTFSRGGLLGGLIAGTVAVAFLMIDRDSRRKMVLVIPLIVVVGLYVIWPKLVEFTGGTLAVRYAETGASHRDELGKEDFNLWVEHPILGVGPGLSLRYHRIGVSTHTEFTRLLAEHGSFGAVAIALLVGFGVRNVLRAPTPREKGLVASALVWSVLFMLNSAMRTVAPSFMYGLSFNIFRPNPGPSEASTDDERQGETSDRPQRRRTLRGRLKPSAA